MIEIAAPKEIKNAKAIKLVKKYVKYFPNLHELVNIFVFKLGSMSY